MSYENGTHKGEAMELHEAVLSWNEQQLQLVYPRINHYMSQILHVLLTGGVGSRLWPLSRISKPKQYLHIFSKNSLFELAVKRNAAFSDRLVVVGNHVIGFLVEAFDQDMEVIQKEPVEGKIYLICGGNQLDLIQ